MASTQSEEERFNLITRGLPEVHGGEKIRAVLAEGRNPRGIWVTAPTGRPHIGYLVPLTKMADFVQAEVEIIVCLGDIYAFLVNYKHPLELVGYRTDCYRYVLSAAYESIGYPIAGLRFIKESSYHLTQEHMIDTLKLCALTSQHDSKVTGEEIGGTTMLSPLLIPGLQALDEEFLESDFDFGGLDQRGLFAFAENFLPQLGYKKRAHLMNTMLPGLTCSKMSASLPNSKIDCLDPPDVVCKKIFKVTCIEGEVTGNGILPLLKILLIPISKLRLEKMQGKTSIADSKGTTITGDRRPFISLDAPEGTVFTVEVDAKERVFKHYKSYDEIEQDFKEKKLHPDPLKTAVASAINELLANIRKSYEGNEEWQRVQKLAYPDPEVEDLSAQPLYDANFCFPVRDLSSERVKLTPFIPSIHGSRYFAFSSSHPELYEHLPLGPFTTEKDFIDNFIEAVHLNPAMVLFAIIDKTRPASNEDESGALAGVIAYINTSKDNLSTEISYIITFPDFQLTHVTFNAVGLLLQYALDSPSDGGLGLGRVQWKTSSANTTPINSAELVGFVKEGVLRWDRVGNAKGKAGNGREVPQRGDRDNLGRDTVVYGFCWDDWKQGGKERVQAAMDK